MRLRYKVLIALILAVTGVLLFVAQGMPSSQKTAPSYESGMSDNVVKSMPLAKSGYSDMQETLASGESRSQSSVSTNIDMKPKIIKTGNVTISVEKDQFDKVITTVKTIVSSCGGMPQSSEITKGEYPYFSAVYRVPVENFDMCVDKLQGVSKDVSISVSSEDRTAQYIDLAARLQVLESQKDFYLGLMQKAKTVDEMLKVRRYLDQTIAQIESIKGQMQYIEGRATYSTLRITVSTTSQTPKPKPWYIEDLENALKAGFLMLWNVFLALIKATIIVVPLFFIVMWLGMYIYNMYKKLKKES